MMKLRFKPSELQLWAFLGGGVAYNFLISQSAFFFFFGQADCGILVPPPGIKPMPPAVDALSPNHWTAREFRQSAFIFTLLDIKWRI